MKRRAFIKLLAACSSWPHGIGCHLGDGTSVADVAGIGGAFANPNPVAAHALWSGEGKDESAYADLGHRPFDVAIVGGGVSGLCAAWKLRQSGIERIVVLEQSAACGGTSLSGELGGVLHPWGAHYINVPPREADCVHEVLCDIGVIEGYDARGWPLIEADALLRWPHERLFVDGRWQEGLEPLAAASASQREDLLRFRDIMLRWALYKGRDGRRAFTLPLRYSSGDPQLRALDQLNMADYLRQEGLDSAPLRWYVDYACRDDYGSLARNVSAWAGIHYFACREYDYRLSDQYPSHTLTWPDGNGRLVRGLSAGLEADQVWTQHLVMRIEEGGQAQRLSLVDLGAGARSLIRANAVIYAGKLHTLPYVLPQLPSAQQAALRALEYSPWLVAAVLIKEGRERSVSAWDSVVYASTSLGYINASHQNPSANGRQVLVYYLPFVDGLAAARRELLQADHRRWVEFIVSDLAQTDLEMADSIERIDIYRWGHGILRPAPGLLWGEESRWRQRGPRGVFLAGCDRSGLPLFEEALYSGIAAAEEAMAFLGHEFNTSLRG